MLTESVPPGTRLETTLVIESVRSTIVDIPTTRKHNLSSLSVSRQSYVIVELQLANEVVGIGEAATLGGPRWSEESVESIKATIDNYLAPAIVGLQADRFELVASRMDAAAKRNNAAKAAIDTALFDAVATTLGLPVAALLGGVVESRFPVFWTLASGDPEQEIDEAEEKLSAQLHNAFKIKVGAQTRESDWRRLKLVANKLGGRALLIVDANQAWDETAAAAWLPFLKEIGIVLVEQPLPAWNIAGMARLRNRFNIPLMADESVFTAHEMLAASQAAACDVVSLKLVKHGGLLNTRKIAAVAEAAGIGLYGGCLLESSIGAAAHLHAFASLRQLGWGCEHFGPQVLTDDLVTEPLHFSNFAVHLPAGPGLGVRLDHDKLRRYARR